MPRVPVRKGHASVTALDLDSGPSPILGQPFDHAHYVLVGEREYHRVTFLDRLHHMLLSTWVAAYRTCPPQGWAWALSQLVVRVPDLVGHGGAIGPVVVATLADCHDLGHHERS